MMRRRGGVVRTVGRTAAVAGTAAAVSGRVHRHQQDKWAAENQQGVAAQQAAYDQGVADAAAAQAPPPAPAPSGGDDVIEQLEKLGSLRDKGILSDDEFEAQKAKILAG